MIKQIVRSHFAPMAASIALLGALAGCHAETQATEANVPASEDPVTSASVAAATPDATPAPSEPAPAGKNAPSVKDAKAESTLAAAVAPKNDEPEAEIPPVTPDPPEAAPRTEPYKVLILGDSLAATGFGALLERRLDAHPEVTCYRKGKSSSGLARPDFFDWMAESKRQVKLRDPDLVVVIMGGNDGQDLVGRKRSKTRRVPWKHEKWGASYRTRMDDFLEQISADDRKVLWLGLPTMGLTSFEKKLKLIRRIQQEAVEALGEDATYIDTAPFVTDSAGKFLTHAKVGKRRRSIRADDRIHFTMSGSEYFAGHIYPEVLDVLALEDPPKDAPKKANKAPKKAKADKAAQK